MTLFSATRRVCGVRMFLDVVIDLDVRVLLRFRSTSILRDGPRLLPILDPSRRMMVNDKRVLRFVIKNNVSFLWWQLSLLLIAQRSLFQNTLVKRAHILVGGILNGLSLSSRFRSFSCTALGGTEGTLILILGDTSLPGGGGSGVGGCSLLALSGCLATPSLLLLLPDNIRPRSSLLRIIIILEERVAWAFNRSLDKGVFPRGQTLEIFLSVLLLGIDQMRTLHWLVLICFLRLVSLLRASHYILLLLAIGRLSRLWLCCFRVQPFGGVRYSYDRFLCCLRTLSRVMTDHLWFLGNHSTVLRILLNESLDLCVLDGGDLGLGAHLHLAPYWHIS